ncbi:hypothetical protein ACQEVC_45340 [Plantactinospora sp. CA-294935]|uniref:hypothetical protein n=1 Tax=Plantactinospora sp. CA-294935 TaxID=3240012 RepID=UPI003D8CE718
MNLLRRKTDPVRAAAQAEARVAEVRAEIERTRLTNQLDRERADAQRQAAEEASRRDRRAQVARRRHRRMVRTAALARIRPVLPLLLINGGAAYAQAGFAYDDVAPNVWNVPSKLAFALAFSAALESVAVYVQWHAHDALLLKAYGTAARLRRSAWLIAAVVGAINYAHFADGLKPTPAAIAFGMLSLLSPWLWGLHTRRVQHVQLLAEDSNLIDDAGSEFSTARRRAFPWRTWQARRWSIDHGVRDPREAWRGYNAERIARKAEKTARKAAVEAAEEMRPAPIQATVSRLPVTELDRVWSAITNTASPAHEPAQPALPAPAREPARNSTNGARVVAAKSRLTSRRGKRTTVSVEPADARLAAAYPRLRDLLGREPSGAELAAEAKVSKATANKWKNSQSREDVTS